MKKYKSLLVLVAILAIFISSCTSRKDVTLFLPKEKTVAIITIPDPGDYKNGNSSYFNHPLLKKSAIITLYNIKNKGWNIYSFDTCGFSQLLLNDSCRYTVAEITNTSIDYDRHYCLISNTADWIQLFLLFLQGVVCGVIIGKIIEKRKK